MGSALIEIMRCFLRCLRGDDEARMRKVLLIQIKQRVYFTY